MPRKAKKPVPAATTDTKSSFDELVEDVEDGDEDLPPVDDTPPPPSTRSRDWRDVEKLKEERRLRQLIDDDLDL
jgi:hypothetical protein